VGSGRRRGGSKGARRVDLAIGITDDIGVDIDAHAVDEPCANGVSRTARAAFVIVDGPCRDAVHAATAAGPDARTATAA
jgi:hypothetical protein